MRLNLNISECYENIVRFNFVKLFIISQNISRRRLIDFIDCRVARHYYSSTLYEAFFHEAASRARVTASLILKWNSLRYASRALRLRRD